MFAHAFTAAGLINVVYNTILFYYLHLSHKENELLLSRLD